MLYKKGFTDLDYAYSIYMFFISHQNPLKFVVVRFLEKAKCRWNILILNKSLSAYNFEVMSNRSDHSQATQTSLTLKHEALFVVEHVCRYESKATVRMILFGFVCSVSGIIDHSSIVLVKSTFITFVSCPLSPDR